MKAGPIRAAAPKLKERFQIPAASPKASTETKSEKPAQLVAEKQVETNSEELNKPLPFNLKDIDPTHPYLIGRRIPEKMAKEFGIGFFPGRGSMAGRVVIPIHDREGRLVAYAGRSIDDSEPKYKFPAGFKKSIELYNLNRVLTLGDEDRNGVIVVEGFFDCIQVYTSGFPNVIGLMGSTLSETQENVLAENFREAILLLDGDEAGRAATEDITRRLA